MTGALTHEALLYRDDDDLVSGVGAFLGTAMAEDHAVLVAVPPRTARVLDAGLGGTPDTRWGEVMLVDMTEVGRNPNRIIGEIRSFVDREEGRPVSVVGEPLWPGRSRDERREVVRHEALVNVAFGDTPLRALCPYDASALDSEQLDLALATHPKVREPGDGVHDNPGFRDPLSVWRSAGELEPVPAQAECTELDLQGLAGIRELVAAHGRRAGLHPDRVDDLVAAAHEVVTNSARHAAGPARLHVWTEPTAVICDVRDRGAFTDPLVGRRQPASLREGGWGLWLVNQLCDLVQIHSGDLGSAVRFRVNR